MLHSGIMTTILGLLLAETGHQHFPRNLTETMALYKKNVCSVFHLLSLSPNDKINDKLPFQPHPDIIVNLNYITALETFFKSIMSGLGRLTTNEQVQVRILTWAVGATSPSSTWGNLRKVNCNTLNVTHALCSGGNDFYPITGDEHEHRGHEQLQLMPTILLYTHVL